MMTEDAGELDPSHDLAAEIAALEHEVRLLHEIRDGVSQPGGDVMVEAATRLIQERQAELERARLRS